MFFQVDGNYMINTQQIVSIVKDTGVSCRLKFKMSNGETYFKTYDFFHAICDGELNKDLDTLLNS